MVEERFSEAEFNVVRMQRKATLIGVSKDKTSLTLYVKNFSQYAITYGNVATDADGNEVEPCYIHWIILGLLVLYILFCLLWYFTAYRKTKEKNNNCPFGKKRGIFPFVVSMLFIIANAILIGYMKCNICLVSIIVSYVIEAIGSLYWAFGKNDGKKKDEPVEAPKDFAIVATNMSDVVNPVDGQK